MKKIIPLCMICFALGMALMLFINNSFIAVIFILLIVFAAYCIVKCDCR